MKSFNLIPLFLLLFASLNTYGDELKEKFEVTVRTKIAKNQQETVLSRGIGGSEAEKYMKRLTTAGEILSNQDVQVKIKDAEE